MTARFGPSLPRFVFAVAVLLTSVLAPLVFGEVGSYVASGWSMLVMLGMLSTLVEHPMARPVERSLAFATWPTRRMIEDGQGLARLWLRPKRWPDVLMLGELWEGHPERVVRQLSRADRAHLAYCTNDSSPAGFCHAVARQITDGEWSQEHEMAAWVALGNCQDAELLMDALLHTNQWVARSRPAGGTSFASIALVRNPVVELRHVVALGLTVREASWSVLELVEKQQQRNLLAEVYPGSYPASLLVTLARDMATPAGTVLALADEPLLSDVCEWLDSIGARIDEFVPVLAHALAEERAAAQQHVGAEHEATVRRAVSRVQALADVALVGRLLAAGAPGSVEELDEAGCAISESNGS